MNIQDLATNRVRFASIKTIKAVAEQLNHKCFINIEYDMVESDNKINVLCLQEDFNYLKKVMVRCC